VRLEYSRTSTSVEISTTITSRLIDQVTDIMAKSQIRPIGVEGGSGWSIDCHQGTLLVVLPIRRAPEVGAILFRLSQLAPEFQTGLEYRQMVQEVI